MRSAVLRVLQVIVAVIAGLGATIYYEYIKVFLERARDLADRAVPALLAIGTLIVIWRLVFRPPPASK